MTIYSQARLYEFPDTNLRKGNRVRLYSGFTKEKKVRTPEGVTYNFSWNLDTPIWDGNHVECYIMSPDERIGFAPCDPIEDHESPAERGTFLPLGEELGMASLFREWRLRRTPQAHAGKGRDRNHQAFKEGKEKQEE